jgi:hypothetical protein
MTALSLSPLAESDLDLIAEWFNHGLADLLDKNDSLASYKLEFKNMNTIFYPDALMGSIDGERAFFVNGFRYSNSEYRLSLLLRPELRSTPDMVLMVWKKVLNHLADRLGSAEITTEIAPDDKVSIEVLEHLGFSLKEVIKAIGHVKNTLIFTSVALFLLKVP